ncbi:DUF6782 family putative metallopeptidase [Nonomuraea cavernae]|uniref:Uncharacterized protein n=1 Tax=Nonomuraea cavernae TaxID=2045107 RepID=A0A917ZAT3_9ACTN|nr:DUF6782 family putative metallopeptidase [Nonomuraea cavernae]MCA2189900.1 hypothetical protein [Nonomuraea cavernae]GGO77831.1 hypothetical protein GCM10012289_58410 [Nonomuraea cavernae]
MKGLDLPPVLAQAYNLVKDVAPWPDSDEDERMSRARAWLDLGTTLRSSAGRIDVAGQQFMATNSGSDVQALKEKLEGADGPKNQLAAGEKAAVLAGAGQMVIVVIRVAFKTYALYLLTLLATSMIAAVMQGPVASFMWTARVAGVRQALKNLLMQSRRHVAEVVAGTISRSRRLLQELVLPPLVIVSLPAISYVSSVRFEESNEEARQETEAVLRETPAGREALAWVRDHGITVLFQEPPPLIEGTYRDNLDVLTVNPGKDPEERAEIFVHEVYHAQNEGRPNSLTMGREEYINASIEEEAIGNIKATEMREQLAAARGEPAPRSSYRHAYQKAISEENNLRAAQGRPLLTQSEEQRIGNQAGLAELRDDISGIYTDRFGDEWDARWYHQARDFLLPP